MINQKNFVSNRNFKRKFVFNLLILLFCFSQNSNSQVKKIGIPSVQNFSRIDYNGVRQIWSIAQQSNGILYFANDQIILQYDGANWYSLAIPNNLIIRSIAVDNNDVIYCGSYNEFGKFTPDKNGILQYESISDKLKEPISFGNIWRSVPTKEGVYFQSHSHLFLYQNDNVLTLLEYSERYLNNSFYENDTLFVHDTYKNKLLAFKGVRKEEKPFPVLPEDEHFISIFRRNKKESIVLTNKNVYLYNERELVKWDIPLAKELVKNNVFSALRIDDNQIAIGSILNGVYIINLEGEIILNFNKQKSLQDNKVLALLYTKDKNLVLGLDYGISIIDINSPFTYFNEGTNLKGPVYDVEIYNNKLYAATTQGVQYANWNNSQMTFNLIEGLKGQAWNLVKVDDKLMVCHNEGLFEIDKNNNVRTIKKDKGAWNFKIIPHNKNLAITGTYAGIIVLKRDAKGIWHFLHKLKGYNFSCHLIEFETDTSFWIAHSSKGLSYFEVDSTFSEIVKEKNYTSKNGLPSDYQNRISKLNDTLIATTINGVYLLNKEKDEFIYSEKYNKLFHNLKPSYPQIDKKGNIWFQHDNKFSLLKKENKKFVLNDTIFNELQNSLITGFEYLYSYDEKNIFIGIMEGLVHYNPEHIIKKNNRFNTIIRNITYKNSSDTLLFDQIYRSEKTKELAFEYKDNMINIVYAAPIFSNNEQIKFQYLLEGNMDKWSGWTRNNFTKISNLSPGEYIFRVRAKNIFGKIAKEASFSFKIRPPWYQTVYAYIFYLISSIVFIYLFAIYFTKKVEQDKIKAQKKQEKEFLLKEKMLNEQNFKAEQKIIKLQNEKLNAEIKTKEIEFDLKKKELASIALQITHKGEMLKSIKQSLSEVADKVNIDAKKLIKKLIKSIDSENKTDADWNQFKTHFNHVHSNFFKKLKANYPELTPKDLRLCAYLRINLSSKEIASLLNITSRGVELARYRLRKKLNFSHDDNLIEFMMKV